ncbi:MAG: hypothetical protein K1X79_02615 [Oligoflexia bacterium]|nr:hypothetical protein [Oligoflexia bacterium]
MLLSLRRFTVVGVKLLTLSTILGLVSCSLTQQYVLDRCNSRAYLRNVVADYLSSRYDSSAPVRLGIIPFSTPANLASRGTEMPGLGNELAWQVRSEIVDLDTIPIVEVLNRQDWPSKKDEFATGNFGAIAAGRDAGYDLILVGKVQPIVSLDKLSAETKLIEAESGITLWSGVTTASSYRRGVNSELSSIYLAKEDPTIMDTAGLVRDLASCIARDIMSEKPAS